VNFHPLRSEAPQTGVDVHNMGGANKKPRGSRVPRGRLPLVQPSPASPALRSKDGSTHFATLRLNTATESHSGHIIRYCESA
jgi:hypothetical protein